MTRAGFEPANHEGKDLKSPAFDQTLLPCRKNFQCFG